MRVLFLILDEDHPATRYRVLYYRPYLEKEGFEVEVVRYPRERSAWPPVMERAQGAEAVVIQKKRAKRRRVEELRRRAGRVIFDVDDAVMYRSPRNRSPHSRTRMRRFRETARAVDSVICGNHFLAEITSEFAEKIDVVPTAIPIDRYPRRDHATANEGELHAFSIIHRSFPGIEVPFISAIADLDGGGTVKTNMTGIDADPEKIQLGMRVQVVYEIAPRKDGEGNEYMTFYLQPAAQ